MHERGEYGERHVASMLNAAKQLLWSEDKVFKVYLCTKYNKKMEAGDRNDDIEQNPLLSAVCQRLLVFDNELLPVRGKLR